MNWDALGAIGEVSGALILIVSVIYLGRQVRESNAHARAESERHVQESWNRILNNETNNRDIMDVMHKGYGSLNDLNDIEKSIFVQTLGQKINHLEMVLRMENNGLLPKDIADTFRKIVLLQVGTPGGLEFWSLSNAFFQKLSTDYLNENLRKQDGE